MVWLALATLLGAVLRFIRLGSIPIALYCDEALHGYEAWSLLTTGRDRNGVLFPLVFDVFGIGWSEPLYIYLTVPAVALFGLTPLAARFVAAAAGTLAIPAAGLMAASLVRSAAPARRAPGKSPKPDRPDLAWWSGVGTAFLMATSPWPFHFSRIAFQASLLPLLLGAGFWLASSGLALEASRARTRRLGAAGACLALTLYTYPVSRVAMPLLATAFAWTHRRELRRHRASALAAVVVLAAFALPMGWFSVTGRGLQRFSDVSIVAGMPGASLGERAMVAATHYVSYLSPRFLLTDGQGDTNPRHGVEGHGVLHPHEVLLLIVGMVSCWRSRSPGGRFLVAWVLLFPVAAALTVDPRHAVRALVGLPGLQAVAGVGLACAIGWAREAVPGVRRRAAIAGLALLAAGSAGGTATYFHDYFAVWPSASAPFFQYGLKEAYEYVDRVLPGHDSVYVTLNEDSPWIQLLFYRKVPPATYQKSQLSGLPYLFGEKEFYKGTRIPGRRNPIFVLKAYEVPGGVRPREVIPYPDGSPAFVIGW